MVIALKPCFSESIESQLSNELPTTQFGQKLVILEHFEVVEQEAIIFCCFSMKTTKMEKKCTKLLR